MGIINKTIKKEEKKETEKVELEKKQEKPSLDKKPLMAWKVLVNPYISEKAGDLEKENKYIFKVFDGANKIQVKQAIKEVYSVDVTDVNIIKAPKKRKRLGKHHGWKKGFKKAIIKVKSGQKIDIHPN